MNNKQCSNKICIDPIKLVSEFYKDKSRKDGLYPQCKRCCKTRKRGFYEENKKEILKQQKEQHGKFPWKKILNGIKQRCNNPKNDSYKYYGGRGIECRITEDELKRLWFRDEAWLFQQPSIDRKDSNKDYTFDNCQFIEKSLNSSKDKIKPILQFDLEGNFIREWESLIEASKKLNINHGNICEVVLVNRKTAGGFIWRYKGEK